MTADSYWGQSPEELTVSASPTPTSTVFTVSDATNLLVNQYILVEVSAAYQRAQITNKSGNILTVTGLSGAPDTPGSVLNSRELVKRDLLNSGALLNAASLSELRAVDITRAPNGLKYLVPGYGVYTYRPSSSKTEDSFRFRVIQPTSGPGRWILTESLVRSIALYPQLMTLPGSGAATPVTSPYHGMSYDPDTDNSAFWLTVVPPDFGDGGFNGIRCRLTVNSTTPEQTHGTTLDVRWLVLVNSWTAGLVSTGFSEVRLGAFESEVYPLYSNTIDLDWLSSAPEPGTLIKITVRRDADNASDTSPDTAILLPCELIYTTEIDY